MKHLPTSRKILSRRALVQSSLSLRADGKRLVLTNGCFDLLHIGHVRYLELARSLGDALAVGLNSDASVRALKGPDRPLTPESERAEIVAALECVDFVCVFSEATATALVAEVRPAVYAKGGDYSPDPNSPDFPVEGNEVVSYGGRVEIIDYIPGRSTTDLVKRLQGVSRPRKSDAGR
jgi:D-beta-D-heptose 7-phosphate kinase/D-beta-D-heptose 1-phosphate adenosyltransferase